MPTRNVDGADAGNGSPRPRFARHLTVEWGVEEWGADALVLVHDERRTTRLNSPLFRQVAPRIDGRRTIEEIAAALPERITGLDVAFAVDWLQERGLVEWVERWETAVESEAGVLAGALGATLLEDAPRLALTVLGGAALRSTAEELAADLRDVHVDMVMEVPDAETSDPVDLRLVLADDWLHPGLVAVHDLAWERGESWLLAQPVGVQIAVGPLFAPGRSHCWHCLAERVAAWRRERRRPLRDEAGAGPWTPRRPSSAWTRRLGTSWAMHEGLRLLWTGRGEELHDGLRIFDLATSRTELHRWVGRPGCAYCGDLLAVRAAGPKPSLETDSDVVLSESTRSESPNATFARYAHLISPVVGLVDEVRPYFSDDDGLVFVQEAQVAPPAAAIGSPAVRCAGRGADEDSARTAALCEALERYSGFFHGDETRRLATFEELGEEAVHPNDCLLVSERQFADRRAWNERGLPFHELPDPLGPGEAIHWTPLWSLTEERQRWLPTAYCYFAFREPSGVYPCRADSNGCAAGSTFEEAVVHGFLELVERDALALWWYHRAVVPALDLASVDDRYVRDLVGKWRALGREIEVLDITTDFGIPTFVAVSRLRRPEPGDLLLGAGCHGSPAVALRSALTELNQFLPGFLEGRPREILSGDPAPDEPYLRFDDRARVQLGDSQDVRGHDPAAQVALCLETARERGLDLLVLEQTRPEVGLPVARVVMPGTRLFRARFAPGRLYDVPVELGWVERALGEDELNPVHILI